MITYSNNATLEWNLDGDETSSAAALDAAIKGLTLIGGFTNTVEGMEVSVEQVFGSSADEYDCSSLLYYLVHVQNEGSCLS